MPVLRVVEWDQVRPEARLRAETALGEDAARTFLARSHHSDGRPWRHRSLLVRQAAFSGEAGETAG